MIKVLSLFDGIAGARQALKNLGIDCEYHAYEIDKYAIKVASANHPDIIHHGDVFNASFFGHIDTDLLIAGSPCQGFSFAGKQLNFEDPRSKLFFEFVRVLKEIKPKYFLLENVKMKKEYQDIISEHLGVEPISINSRLVTAQNRQRNYWTNISNIEQPEDKKIVTYDILEEPRGFVGALRGRYLIDGKRQDHKMKCAGLTVQRLEMRKDGKTNALTTVHKDNVVVLPDGSYRYLTPLECERLQGFESGYTNSVSNTQRYKALGNSFTIPVIEHILKHIKLY